MKNNPKENTRRAGKPASAKVGPPGRPMMMRCVALLLVFAASAAALGLRLAQLQIEEASVWDARAAARQVSNIPLPPLRGNIYDTNMNLMAQSATVWTVECAPNILVNNALDEDSPEQNPAVLAARELAVLLEIDQAELYENISNKDKKYYRIKAKIEKPVADAVRAFCEEYGVSGIYLVEDTKRYYPYENLASTLLGFVGADNNGLEGIERWYEETLAGVAGRTVAVTNAWGGEIPAEDTGVTYPAEDGNSIVLTINVDIQRALETQLQAAVEKYHARQRGMAIAMDVNTGAILGLAVWPSYDPNRPYDILDLDMLAQIEMQPAGSEARSTLQAEARTLQWRNKALADTYEPGSVLKILTAAAALDSGKFSQESMCYCGGSIMVDGWDEPMSCALGTAHGQTSLRNALINSCNVSFIQLSAGMGAATWYDYIRAFGLTEPTGVDLPGEPSQASINNLVYGLDQMGPVQLASCSFGQSNKYTMVQMITAISAAVNGGNLMQPYIVKQELDAFGNVVKNHEPIEKRQVISPETSAQICDMLEELVEGPNGDNAYLAGYRIGGKSGTSQKLEKLDLENEEEQVYISSFMGFAPADKPEIAVLLALDEPEDPTGTGTYFGGRLAAPYVRNTLKECLDLMGVEPQYSTDAEQARTTVNCPKVTEMDVNAALGVLNKNNLTPRVVGGGTEVIGQFPAAYAPVPHMGEVILYTDASMPQETVKVPNLVGRTAQNAAELLRSLGLNVLTSGAPDDGAGVKVASQSHAVDDVVPKATVITLYLENTTQVADL